MELAPNTECFITPLPEPPQRVCIDLPCSKSMLNRSLLMYALQYGRLPVLNTSREADDVALMYKVLGKILKAPQTQEPVTLCCGNTGTVVRMATVVAAFSGGRFIIHGDRQMEKRPMKELIEMLQQLGVHVECTGIQGFLPLIISSSGFSESMPTVSISATLSSQHLSGLLLTAPFISKGLRIDLMGDPVSWPYVELTIKMMHAAGATVSIEGNRIHVEEGRYTGGIMDFEADWSSAAFWFQALTLLPLGSELFLNNLKINSNQGDEMAVNLFQQLGIEAMPAESGIRIRKCRLPNPDIRADFTHCPDLFNTFAMAVATSGAKGVLTGITHLPFKESDRLANLCNGLKENGFPIELAENSLSILPGNNPADFPLRFHGCGDHRVAMSAAVLGVKYPVIIKEPMVVSKSFPGFYTELRKLAMISRGDRF
jgi:3-phosphoshikimate 1-carboxyvinyltransferase